jgi:hypothetical protein
MGTRGLIRLCDAEGKVYATIYCHWDAYPEGLGVQLYKFLKDFSVGNGLDFNASKMYAIRKYTEFLNFLGEEKSTTQATRDHLKQAVAQAKGETEGRLCHDLNGSSHLKQANGPGCLYAQLIAHLKVTVGSIYLELPSTPVLVAFEYEIRASTSGVITIQVNGEGEVMDLKAFGAMCGVESGSVTSTEEELAR